MKIYKTLPILLVLGLLLLAGPGIALEDPTSARGFEADKVYQLGDLDHVGLFNGNLSLTLPIGPSFPVGGNLSYQLVLVYNSNLWDFEHWCDQGDPGDRCFTFAKPAPGFMAGAGWNLTLGRLLPPGTDINPGGWTYEGPDGGRHLFYTSLHLGETVTSGVFYTRDGSYLRMRVQGSQRRIEMPDGRYQLFEEIDPSEQEWRLVEYGDPFGNEVTIDYFSNRWEISDSQGRLHTVHLQATGHPEYPKRISSVDFEKFGGTATDVATYTFTYHDATLQRSCPHFDGAMTPPAEVLLLDSIVLPGSNNEFTMTYLEPNSGNSCAPGSGTITQLTLPTLGSIEWTYQSWNYPMRDQNGCGISNMDCRAPANIGVAQRILRDRDGNGMGTWTYQQELTSGPVNFQNVSRVKVTDPVGNYTYHYFSVHRDEEDENGYSPWDYGLPFTRDNSVIATDPWTNGPVELHLSTEVFAPGGTTPLRRTYVRYQKDEVDPFHEPSMEEAGEVNRREIARRVEYTDDGNHVDTFHRDFDGLGHFRETLRKGSYQADEGRTMLTNYNPGGGSYNVADDGTVSGGFTPPTSTGAWILGTYDFTEQVENFQARSPGETPSGFDEGAFLGGPVTARQEFQFDTSTGFLQCRRKLWSSVASPSRTADDVVEAFVVDGDGNVAEVRTYGGDLNQAPNGSVCGTLWQPSGEGTPEYWEKLTWEHGALKRRAYWEKCGGADTEVLRTLDQTIDADTGLVASSFDTGGRETTFDYDALGRLVSVEPAEESGTYYEYVVATSDLAARVEVERRNSVNGSALTEQHILFDDQGRICRENTRLPDGTWNRKDTSYYGTGWVHRVSQPIAASGSGPRCADSISNFPHTRNRDYDPFGRVGRVTPPDGAGHDVDFAYLGERQTRRTVRIATGAAGAETQESTTERYDPHGRLRLVQQTVGGTTYDTEYDYTVENLLRKVTAGNQTRTFSYDRRGFLEEEKHPELIDGVTSPPEDDGKIFYPKVDSRGHARERDNQVQALTYDYDRAERLTQVRELNGGVAGRLLKEYSFYPGWTSGVVKPHGGKLYQAKRHNYGSPPSEVEADLIVTESYEYGGTEGRVSERQTRLSNGGRALVFEQSFGYNSLGNLLTLGYPSCLHQPCSNRSSTPSRTQAYQYSRGALTGITGWATQSYHPNGALNQVVHTSPNGVTDTYGLDPDSMTRPASIAFAGGSINWNLGTYQYDGAGNVKAIGSDTFRYDDISRLTHSTLASTGNDTQNYTYDRHGNLTSITTNGAVENVSVDSATNQLTLPGTTYDSAGNTQALTVGGIAQSYTWDALDMMTLFQTSSNAKGYVYTADDERLVEIDWSEGGWVETWSVRDLGGKVLRQWRNTVDDGENWIWLKDYVYRDGQLLGSVTDDETRHFHLDHLGTPRLITDPNGNEVARHTYFPFGEEVTNPAQNNEQMKFTGHERDSNGNGTGDDLDYMHARYCSPNLGRFLSVDPMERRKPIKSSQLWNRYSYVANNPLKFIDPDGEDLRIVFDFSKSGLTPKKQVLVARGIRARFVNAGVSPVQTFLSPDLSRPRDRRGVDTTIHLEFHNSAIGGSSTAMGSTPRYPGNRAEVTMLHAPTTSAEATLNYAINVGAHEAGHATGALPQYANDNRPVGTVLFPKNAEEGSIMEQGPSAVERSTNIREFSAADAKDLRDELLPPGGS